MAWGDWLGELRAELETVAGNEAAPREAAFAQAVTGSLELPDLLTSLQVLYDADPGRGGSPSYRLLRAAVGTIALTYPMQGRRYPHDYPEPGDIANLLQWIYEDPSLTNELHRSLQQDANHTSMPQRYAAELIVGMALGHTVSNPAPARLDIGCSLQYGNIQVLSRDVNPFSDIQVLVRSSSGQPERHPEKTRLLNETLRRPDLTVPDRVVGIDKVDVTTVRPERIQASLTLDEIVNGAVFEMYRRLAATDLKPGSLSFMIADAVSKDDMQAVVEAMGGERFDVVSAVAAMHSYGAAQLKRTLQNIKRHALSRDGYAYFADFLNLLEDESGGRYLGPMARWRGMNVIAYSRAVDPRMRLLARFTTGRALAIEFYEDFGNVAEGNPVFGDVARELSS